MKRTPLKRSPMKRRKKREDWREAIAKVRAEGCCRYCGTAEMLDPAHIAPKEHDPKVNGVAIVKGENILPLCRTHHDAFDQHRLDLSDVVEPHEWEYAVREHPGGEYGAERRITGRRPE